MRALPKDNLACLVPFAVHAAVESARAWGLRTSEVRCVHAGVVEGRRWEARAWGPGGLARAARRKGPASSLGALADEASTDTGEDHG